MKDYYKILGVDKKSTKSDIKKAYRTLSKKYHPDTNHGDQSMNHMFTTIHMAYKWLMQFHVEPIKRANLHHTPKPKVTSENLSTDMKPSAKVDPFNIMGKRVKKVPLEEAIKGWNNA